MSYWHEYLDLVFFFKAINGLIVISPDVLPQPIIPKKVTRCTSNVNALTFRPHRCKTVSFQRSFLCRITRIWNILPEHFRLKSVQLRDFKRKLKDDYYTQALINMYDPENPRTWRSICPSCGTARSLAVSPTCCF